MFKKIYRINSPELIVFHRLSLQIIFHSNLNKRMKSTINKNRYLKQITNKRKLTYKWKRNKANLNKRRRSKIKNRRKISKKAKRKLQDWLRSNENRKRNWLKMKNIERKYLNFFNYKRNILIMVQVIMAIPLSKTTMTHLNLL